MKNSCDRNFNILKQKWYKCNVYTFQQSLDLLGESENVEMVDATNLHYDVRKMMSEYYDNLGSGMIRKNHIFKLHEKRKNKVGLKSKTSNIDPMTQVQNIRRDKHKKSPFLDDIRKLQIKNAHRYLVKMKHLRLKPVKQLDLYVKWRKIVPQEFKDITCPLSPENIIK